MTKSDLKTGMVVTLRNGRMYSVFTDTCINDYKEGFLLNMDSNGYLDMEHFNDNMLVEGSPMFDIMVIYEPECPSGLYNTGDRHMLWERL